MGTVNSCRREGSSALSSGFSLYLLLLGGIENATRPEIRRAKTNDAIKVALQDDLILRKGIFEEMMEFTEMEDYGMVECLGRLRMRPAAFHVS